VTQSNNAGSCVIKLTIFCICFC